MIRRIFPCKLRRFFSNRTSSEREEVAAVGNGLMAVEFAYPRKERKREDGKSQKT